MTDQDIESLADACVMQTREVIRLEAKIAELEKQLKEGEALVIELVAALKNQPTEE